MYYVMSIADRWGVDIELLLVCNSEEICKGIRMQYGVLEGFNCDYPIRELEKLSKELKITVSELETYLQGKWKMYYEEVSSY